MFDGSYIGRGFESALGPYVFSGIAVISILLWVLFHFQIRRFKKEEQAEKDARARAESETRAPGDQTTPDQPH